MWRDTRSLVSLKYSFNGDIDEMIYMMRLENIGSGDLKNMV